jgi:RNA ligase
MAHVNDLGFTLTDLFEAESRGEVRSQVHPTKPELRIYNYTEDVQFSKKWNNITLQCRGLILQVGGNDNGRIVARPWKKFFNFGERDLEIDFNAPVEVTDKMDGSLGILYHDGDDWAIATRGSFASDQAIHATRVLHEKYAEFVANLDYFGGTETLLFEIIYPDNRIVVNYGLMDDLVLLGSVSKQYGFCTGPDHVAAVFGWKGPVVETFDYPTFGTAISAVDREGKEGIVIRSGSKMVKLKQADYVELHRIVTNLSPRTVWQQLGDGKTVADICAQIPDEFHKYVEEIGNELNVKASRIKYDVSLEFFEALTQCIPVQRGWSKDTAMNKQVDRTTFAAVASKSKHKKYLFLMLDDRPIDDVVWAEIKPRGDEPLVKD